MGDPIKLKFELVLLYYKRYTTLGMPRIIFMLKKEDLEKVLRFVSCKKLLVTTHQQIPFNSTYKNILEC